MPFLEAFFVPLRSTSKASKNIVLYFDFIFYEKWVTSIYNAETTPEKLKQIVDKCTFWGYN